MKISVDIDGVLLDLMLKFCEIYNLKYNSDFKPEDATRWEFFRDWNIPEDLVYEIFNKAYEESDTTSLIDVNAPNILEKLNKENQIDLVTARNQDYKKQLLERLNSLGIKQKSHYKKLIYVDPKPYDIKLKLDYEIFIDDNPNLVNSIQISTNKKLFLYIQPWNKYIKKNSNIFRVSNWNQIESLIL